MQRNTIIYVYMLFRTCSKFAAFWYQKSALDFFSNLYIAELYFFGVKSITPSENLLLVTSLVIPMLIVAETKSSESIFGPFGNKGSEFYFFACLGLFVVHFIAISGNPLLATSFVYPLLVGAEKLLYMFFCTCSQFAAFWY